MKIWIAISRGNMQVKASTGLRGLSEEIGVEYRGALREGRKGGLGVIVGEGKETWEIRRVELLRISGRGGMRGKVGRE